MTTELKAILDQWSSYPSKFIKRSYYTYVGPNGNNWVGFFFEFKDETSTLQKRYQIPLDVLEDIDNCGFELDNFWLTFNGYMITHLESHWVSVENEAPIPNRNLDLAIISSLFNPNTQEFSSVVHFSEGIFNGSYFQINDINAADDVNHNQSAINFWKYL